MSNPSEAGVLGVAGPDGARLAVAGAHPPLLDDERLGRRLNATAVGILQRVNALGAEGGEPTQVVGVVDAVALGHGLLARDHARGVA